MSIQLLKGLNLDRLLDTEEAVALSAYARTMETEYDTLGIPIPEWLAKSSDVLRQEIARRTHATDLAELQKIERELDGYKTVGERKNDAQRRLSALQSKLGMTPAKASR